MLGIALLLLTALVASAQAPAGGYVGGEVCKTCHSAIWFNFYKNPHYKTIAAGTLPPEKTGCEGCHGPGKAHVEARGGKTTIPRAFSLMPPKQILDTCLNCHSKDLSRANIRRSSHTEADVVCSNCHSIHKAATPKFLLAKKQIDLCYTCHADVRAQFDMPVKHRVNEGFMQCSDCHNPHGAFAPTTRTGSRPRMLEQYTNEEPCLRCHADKRGPFVFEHPPVKVEGCEGCHVPHGSTNARLLTRPVVFTVCLECHNGAGNFGRQGDGIKIQSGSHNMFDPKYRNCTTCHVRIHGSNTAPEFPAMRAAILASMIFAGVAATGFAQQVITPTPETVGSARGENMGGYNITNSFETGYRFADIDGNRGKYRSDVNFRNGFRLLGSSFAINSKDGHGGMFDEIILSTQGLGNDPYEFANLRIQKNGLYRYDMLWREDDYYNPGLTISEGRHFRDTSRRMQDHDLILLPQYKIQFRLGYSRNNQDGPALSTVQLFDARGDEFTPFADIKRIRNEYRVGNDLEFAGFKFSWTRSWENFKEDTSYLLGSSSPGANPQDVTSLTSFNRVDPYHGNTSFWRGNLHGERKLWAINARITYVGAKRDFVLDEFANGINRTAINRQTLATGDASRPTTAGDFSLSFFPSDRLSVVNNTSVYTTRIDGDSSYTDVNNSVATATVVFFRFLGIRTITNSTDLTYRASPKLSFYGGYHYSTRLIRSIENFDLPSVPGVGDSVAARQDNHVNSGLMGIRFKPIKPLTISLDGELSRADRPFTPISDRNFHAVRGRIQYKAKTLLLSGNYRQNYNTNSVSISTHSARARSYSFDSAWSPGGWLSFNAGYSKIHLDTVSGIAFFAAGSQVNGLNSIYISNAHVGNFGARMAIKKLADLYVGYTITKDTGDGRSSPVPAGTTDPAALLLLPAQTFPLSFQSPLARLSVRLSQKMRWNAGWQFYNYHEKFQIGVAPQNYRANTGYTSVLWSF